MGSYPVCIAAVVHYMTHLLPARLFSLIISLGNELCVERVCCFVCILVMDCCEFKLV